MKKKELRKEILEIRRAQSEDEKKRKSVQIWKRLKRLPEFKNADTVMFYISLPDEVDTERMIKESITAGKKVVVPVVNREKGIIEPSELKDYEKELEPGTFGILEPKPAYRRRVNTRDIDLVVVPGVAFDRCGNRLGFGAGFYDRFLKGLRGVPFVGLAFDFQLKNRLPSGLHDISMDIIITENCTVNCRKGKGK